MYPRANARANANATGRPAQRHKKSQATLPRALAQNCPCQTDDREEASDTTRTSPLSSSARHFPPSIPPALPVPTPSKTIECRLTRKARSGLTGGFGFSDHRAGYFLGIDSCKLASMERVSYGRIVPIASHVIWCDEGEVFQWPFGRYILVRRRDGMGEQSSVRGREHPCPKRMGVVVAGRIPWREARWRGKSSALDG